MVKDCKVIMNNSVVTVIRDGAQEIQIPAIHRNASKVRVLVDGGKYTVVSDNYTEKPKAAERPFDKNKKPWQRKTTIDEKKDEAPDSKEDHEV